MEAAGGLLEWKTQTPFGLSLETLEQTAKIFHVLAKISSGGLQRVISDGAGFRGKANRFQPAANIHFQHFPPADADDPSAAMGLDPAEGGIHQQGGQFTTAM